MKSAEIRKLFLSFFAEHGHSVLPSSSLVPERDPTLFFTNAGMVQFKDIFTGAEKTELRRAVTVQKCMRVSGKHNDLENVGRTPRHHTFFEMLGNFSFGDYFKSDAIPMAWELLTRGYKLDPARLWVTIFEEDDEAAEIWLGKVGLPRERLQRLGAKDNFWAMGDTGPCGPCSEIHWDHGPKISSDTRGPAGESPRYVEIWNNVFMQYEQSADGSRTLLPRPSIDTGMGLERLAAILQGHYSNYDTDLFQGIIGDAARLANVKYGAGGETDVALRVIADHARASAFLVSDNVMPSNDGRGYVLRRVMRRAIRYGVKLGLKEPFLWQAADAVIRDMSVAWPELAQRRDFVLEIIRGEEERFAETLEKGMALLDRELDRLVGVGPSPQLHGEIVFKLHDTFGFPPDLTRLIAEERSVGVDEVGYEALMEEQREKGRANWKGSGGEAIPELQRALAEELEPTIFLGYETDAATSEVAALLGVEGRAIALGEDDRGAVIVRATPFYAESGGQIGDVGEITWERGRFVVEDTQKGPGDIYIHHGRVTEGILHLDSTVRLRVSAGRRDLTRLNHTATHLLHAALRRVLGEHVTQKGSLVSPERLRFDFAHHKPMSAEELRQVEDLVIAEILRNTEVRTRLMAIDAARGEGAMALFGEKYGDEVRVVSVAGFSTELCGGTHARRTGDIGVFRLVSESGVAAGVRRIEAMTGPGAFQHIRQREDAVRAVAERLRTPVEDLDDAVARLQADRKRLEREIEQLRAELARATTGDVLSRVREIHGLKVLAAEIPGDANTLRNEADRLRDQLGSGLVVLGSRSTGTVILIAAATKDLGKRVHAGNIVRELAKRVGGSGGGRPDLAQAGGKDADKLPEALEAVYDLIGTA